jgi:hypothetical protein
VTANKITPRKVTSTIRNRYTDLSKKKMKQETLSPCFGHYKQCEDFSYLAKIVYSGKKSRAALLGW